MTSTANLDELSNLFQIPIASGTMNRGSDLISTGSCINAFARFTLLDTTSAELMIFNEIFKSKGITYIFKKEPSMWKNIAFSQAVVIVTLNTIIIFEDCIKKVIGRCCKRKKRPSKSIILKQGKKLLKSIDNDIIIIRELQTIKDAKSSKLFEEIKKKI